MTALALIGGVLGFGLACILWGARIERPGLVDAVARFEPAAPVSGRPRARSSLASDQPMLASVGATLSGLMHRIGRPLARPEDLAIVSRDEDRHLAAVGMTTLCLGAAGALAATMVSTTIVPVPPVAIGGTAVLSATIGMLLPGLDLRRAAARERERFVRALGCWLELVALAQAGGMGVESALQASSEISNDRSFLRLRSALEQSQVAATTPWQALGRLGIELRLPQLTELAGTLSLAGTEGARVRTTLVAKASSLRQRQMAKAQAEANATTERLFLPSIILMMAFIIFLMYPAGVRLAHVF